MEQPLPTRKRFAGALRRRSRNAPKVATRAINQDAMSEEFQTVNEEVETSKEELQSLNEELTALNSQLQETLEQNRSVANDLENILNSADVATLFLDEQFNIRFFTPAVTPLFSMIASDIGRPLADLASHFAEGRLLADARAVLSSLTPITREVMAENGAWYTCRILPYRTKDNRIEGVVITFVDVTERKQAEDAVNAAKLAAETANLGKSRFLAAASHDLRQPLQTFILLLDLLEMEVEDSPASQLIVRGREALTAMSGMLNTLLDINQLEAGVISPEIVDFPIDDLLKRLRTEFAYHTQSRGLDWRVLPCELSVRSDPRLLEQMIRNLLSNAVKYTAKGGILLGCRRRGGKLRIEVWDTGPGIPSSQFREIFKEFHQIDNPGRDRSRGLGLGLAIVQRLGDMLHHVVNVRSRVSSGSVFTVDVPIVRKARGDVSAGAIPKRQKGPPQSGLILIVEDDRGIRDAFEMLLKATGHRTAVAASGEEAEEVIIRNGVRPDMAILDYNLPRGLTGVQILTRLRERLGSDLPALIVTGDISTETLSEISKQNCVHRSKPIKGETLTQVVQQILAEPRAPPNISSSRHVEAAGTQLGNIFVVDDDIGVCDAIRAMLRAEGALVETYTSGEEFLSNHDPHLDGCLLVDAKMPGMDGLELLERLKAKGQQLPAIMITGEGDVQMAVRAIKAGADDFIEKPIGRADLLARIAHAIEHSSDLSQWSTSRYAATARFAALTPRERQVMELVLVGQPSKNIAADLGVSQRTIESHRASLMRRVGAKTLPELVRLAVAAT
jgi:two-component system CheB/CheR fusion protein